MDEYILKTENMSVGYHRRPLISEIELGLQKGQIMTLIGPNGAGKSTILKSIAGQLSLMAGVVYIEQKALKQFSGGELAKRMSVLMTEQIRPELMTCRDVVAAGRYPYTGNLGILGREDYKKIDEALELVNGRELAFQSFGAISDGQRQRIMLARAICQEPEIMILDEPTSFLDIRHKLEFLTILRRLVKEQNMAVIMALHELDLAQKISDIVVCVKGACIDKYGTPDEIFKQDYIGALYGIEQGSYNAAYGCVELSAIPGKPQVFVIGGGGSGISTYRRLQREGIPFAVGILPQNDVDYPVANALAVKVVAAPAYEPATEQQLKEASALMEACAKVLCPLKVFGAYNEMNKKLYERAVSRGFTEQ